MNCKLYFCSSRPLRKDVEGLDPRWRADYKASETSDHDRTVWVRGFDAEDGVRVQISFAGPAAAPTHSASLWSWSSSIARANGMGQQANPEEKP
ncbi:MAG: hypothetical protein L0099_17455 [Acidobacteria bacterium]|nr:hypothetical protein [Acidobacteriota bacterium]